MADVTVSRLFVNEDFYGTNNAPVYSYSRPTGGAAAIDKGIIWAGATPGGLGTFTSADIITAQENLCFDGTQLLIGDISSVYPSNYGVVVGSADNEEVGGVHIVGSQNAGEGATGLLSFHNNASSHAQKLIAALVAYRDNDDDAGKVAVRIADTSATVVTAMEFTASKVTIPFLAGTGERIVTTDADGDIQVISNMSTVIDHTDIGSVGSNTHSQIDSYINTFGNHLTNTSNPHSVDAADIGTFGSAVAGVVPASGGGTTNFLRADGTWAAAGGSGMVYPDAGIALSTGSAWGTSITNNSANWNTAYGWGDHAGLYDALGAAAAITPTTLNLVIGTDVLAYRTFNDTNWDTAYGWGDHAGLYDVTGTASAAVSSHESTYNHAHYNTAYTHSQLTSGNPHSVTYAELDGTQPAPVSHTLLSHTISGETLGHVLAANSATTYSIRQLLGSEINNDLGWTTAAGTVTSVTGGTGIDSTGGATPSITLDCNELAAGGALVATDKLVAVNGTASQTQLISSIPLSIFNNDSNWNNYTHPNHSGQVTSTGDGATVVTVSAITAQTATTTIVGTDELLVNDGGALRRADVSVLATYMQNTLSFGTGTVTSVTGGTGIDSTGGTTPSISLDCNELTAGGTLVATDKLVAVNGTASQTQLISSIPLSIFNNDSSWNNYSHPNHSGQVTSSGDGATVLTVSAITAQTATTTITGTDELLINDGGALRRADVSVLQTYMQNNLTFGTGTVTSVTGGTGIDSTGGTTPSISLDCNELGAGGTLVATDKLVAVNGTASQTQLISSIPLSIFNDDLGYTAAWSRSGTEVSLVNSGDGVRFNSNEQLRFGSAAGAYIDCNTTNYMQFSTSSAVKFSITSQVLAHTTLRGSSTGAIDLGTTTVFWKDVYATKYYVENVNTSIALSGTDMALTSAAAGTVNLADVVSVQNNYSMKAITIDYSDDGVELDLETILEGVAWWKAEMYVSVGFNSNSNRFRIGNDVDGADYYMDISAGAATFGVGWKALSLSNDPDFISSSAGKTITCQYDDNGTGGTQGTAILYFFYYKES